MSSGDLTIMILAGGVTAFVIGVAALWFSPRLEKVAPQLYSPAPSKRVLHKAMRVAFILVGFGLLAFGVYRMVHLTG